MIQIHYSPGATPIDGDELSALIPAIQTQSELNQYERENIRRAMRWAESGRKLRQDLLTVAGLRLLHKQMFNEVWRWAGKFRITQKNIGVVDAHQIAPEVHKLCEDVKIQIAQHNVDLNLIAVTFHHRLVSIHPFANGNGRHARLAANIMLQYHQRPQLPWGASDLIDENEIRSDYLACLRKADRGDINPLLQFAMRSN